MSLINSTLAFGLGLAVIPVILHMVLKAKPRRIEFPALRLLKARQPSNARRMQLKHLLLLFLRCLLITVLVIAMSRPSLPAANYGLRWWEWLFLVSSVAAAAGWYRLQTARDAAHVVGSTAALERQGRQKVWSVMIGLLAILLTVGMPWGLRVYREITAPRNETLENVPVAAVFVIDTSISMNYRNENLTRLEHARRIIEEHIRKLPAGSRVAISGLRADEDIVFQADLAVAASRLGTLEVTPTPDFLNRRLKTAVQLQADDRDQTQEQTAAGDQFARELYVITDLSRSAWKIPDESGLADALKSADWLSVYLIDVSVPNPQNASLTGLTLSEESSVAGRELLLSMTITATPGMSGALTAETMVYDASGIETRLGAPQRVNLESGSSRIVSTVRIPGNTQFLEGCVRLTSEDPLQDDNLRYFCCGIYPRPRVLLISDVPDESLFVKWALQPDELERLGIRLCDVTSEVTASVNRQTLSNFDAVILINVARPDESLWSSLKTFAEDGGGILLCAGTQRLQPAAWMTPSAREVIPGLPLRPVRFFGEPGHLRIDAETHPLMKEFAAEESTKAELSSVAFDRAWALDPLEGTVAILNLTDGRATYPIFLERPMGRGRIVIFGSAMDNLRDGGSLWNNFSDSWTFVVLLQKTLEFITGVSGARHNFVAGVPVEIPVAASERFEQFLLRRPGLRQTRGTLPADRNSVLISDAEDPGIYHVRPFESASPFASAFAVNFSDRESDLTHISEEELQSMMDLERLTIVNNPSDLQRTVRAGRLGIEVFPVLAGLLLLLFCTEHLMANYFYAAPKSP